MKKIFASFAMPSYRDDAFTLSLPTNEQAVCEPWSLLPPFVWSPNAMNGLVPPGL